MGQVNLLIRLQDIDTAIQQHRKRLGEVLREQKASGKLAAAQAEAASTAAELQRWRQRQQALEHELNDNEREVTRSQNRLYSGDVKNPKELTDLQKKIASLQRRRGDIEDEMLEALVEGEQAEAVAGAAAAVLTEIEAQRSITIDHLQKEQHTEALALGRYMKKRDALLPQIEPGMLVAYEALAKRKNGVAVARLKQGMCLGCKVREPAGIVAAAERGELTYCNNCGRILSVE